MAMKELMRTFIPNGQLVPLLDRYLITRPEDPTKPRARAVIHPSQVHGCKRALLYSIIEAPGTGSRNNPPKLERIFDNGHSVHARIQDYLVKMKVVPKLSNGKDAVEVWLRSEEMNVEGHADGIVKLGGIEMVLEIKSMNLNQFSQLRKPKDEHILQVHLYMMALNIKRALFLYECKDNQELKEFQIVYDEKLGQYLKDRCKEINVCLRDHTLPDREACPNGANSSAAKYCPYAKICFTNHVFDQLANPEILKLLPKKLPRFLMARSAISPSNTISPLKTVKRKIRLVRV